MATQSELAPWKKLPKIELHCHMEGAIRFSTIHEFSEDLHGMSEEEARSVALVNSPSTGLVAALACFDRPQKFLSTPERIERATYEVCIDMADDGVTILELRYQPSFIRLGNPHLSFDTIHQAVLRGARKAESERNICVGLIGIIGRDLSLELAEESADFMIANSDTFIGADLANAESGNDCKRFAYIFDRIRDAGISITVHQGEEDDPKYVPDAVKYLHASRIGHGIQSINSEEVMDFLKENNIPLEVCVTSNYIVGVIPSKEEHPITALRNKGISVTVNTDDPVLFGDYTMSSEYEMLTRLHKWTVADFRKSNQISYASSFIPEEKKSKFWSTEAFDKAAADAGLQ